MNSASGTSANRRLTDRAGRWLFRVLAAVGLVTVLVIATPIDRWWAHAYAGSMDQPKGDVLILLSAANEDHGFISYSSYWRARYALLAWQNGGYKTIVISGEASPSIRDFLVAEGIPPSAILLDPQSTTTRENAIDTARLLKGVPGSRVLLTSDFHMYRAERLFRREGIDVIPYPAPDVVKLSQHWNGRISGFETLAVETAKIVYYRLRGWI
ncbi:MAG TPA: YdcF family protein [Acidobacteriaceae bacterium]|nr:YdcF family protein [Acidobacteriaceae bacterium]